jgi:pimeloyl-ACP methyl ester carboxylesterase
MPEPRTVRTEVGRYDYVLSGEGSPIVVFEAGFGNGKAVWDPVFVPVGRTTRAFAYDRAGMGNSVARSNDRSAAQVVNELRQLLKEVGLAPPYILVSHSLGAVFTEYFARAYPGDVAGLVFADGMVRDFVMDCFPMENPVAQTCPATRVMRESFAESNTGLKEWQGMRNTVAQLRDAGPFPPVPVVVISGTRGMGTDPLDRAWLAERKRLVGLSPKGREVVCGTCGFAVQHDSPQQVIQAVRDIVAQTRR